MKPIKPTALTALVAIVMLAGSLGSWALLVPPAAAGADDDLRHAECRKAWRASPAATWQQCTMRGVHWDSFLWSMQTDWRIIGSNNNHLQKQMEHSKCWVDVVCDHGTPLFVPGTHRNKINYTEVGKLRRCRSNPTVVNSTCDPLTIEEVQQVTQSTSGNHRLSMSNVTVTEGRTATFRLELSEPVDFAIRYFYYTRAGTAESGQDYAHKSGAISIPSGHRSASVRVKTESDYYAQEEDEHFFLDLKSLYTLGRQPGTYTWVYDPGAGLPANLTVRATIKNKVNNPSASSDGGFCHPKKRAARLC